MPQNLRFKECMRIVSCFKLFFQLYNGFAHSPQGSSVNLNVQCFTHSFDC